MPSLIWSISAMSALIMVLFVSLMVLWLVHTLVLYVRGTYHYRRHLVRVARKEKGREQEEALRTWKRANESAWVEYQFQLQLALVTARKLPSDWSPDLPSPPCEPPPAVVAVSRDDRQWEDAIPWAEAPPFCRYWCDKSELGRQERQVFDEQHVYRHKTTDEYYEWKRRHDDDLQKAIRDHPIANTFLKMSKNVNEYNMQII